MLLKEVCFAALCNLEASNKSVYSKGVFHDDLGDISFIGASFIHLIRPSLCAYTQLHPTPVPPHLCPTLALPRLYPHTCAPTPASHPCAPAPAPPHLRPHTCTHECLFCGFPLLQMFLSFQTSLDHFRPSFGWNLDKSCFSLNESLVVGIIRATLALMHLCFLPPGSGAS